MDSIWLEYAWTLLVLIGLEGVLSADNALVMAVIAQHLPNDEKKKAINYGIIGAFIFRFAALFAISFIANIWQVQAVGAVYLIYLGLKHIFTRESDNDKKKESDAGGKAGFWPTVIQIGLTDLAFAVDSILAAVALAIVLPDSPLPDFGGMDAAQFAVVALAGIAGLILIKFAATWFVKLLEARPGLETTAYILVAWVGIKLAVLTLSHEEIGVLDEGFPDSAGWKITFWSVLVAIIIIGWFTSDKNTKIKKVK